jgi:hypothetical protein
MKLVLSFFLMLWISSASAQIWEEPMLAEVKNLPNTELLQIMGGKDSDKSLKALIQWHINMFPQTQKVSQQSMIELAKKGVVPAMYQAAVMLRDCKGCSDRVASLAWLKEAANNGHPAAAEVLAGAYEEGKYGLEQSAQLAFRYYEIAANGGLKSSMLNVIASLCRGVGASKDLQKAALWINRINTNGDDYDLEDLACPPETPVKK